MESKKIDFFNKLSFVLLLFTIFACFFFFIPFSPVTLEASKGFLLSVGATLSLFFWFVARLGEGKFVIPKDKLVLFGGVIPLIFLVSSFFSPSYNTILIIRLLPVHNHFLRINRIHLNSNIIGLDRDLS